MKSSTSHIPDFNSFKRVQTKPMMSSGVQNASVAADGQAIEQVNANIVSDSSISHILKDSAIVDQSNVN